MPVYYDPYDIRIVADPYPTYTALRDEAPLYYNERYDFWALSRHADVEAALADWQTFSSARSDIVELPGRQPGPVGGPGGARRAAGPLAGVGPGPRQHAAGARFDRPRLGGAADHVLRERFSADVPRCPTPGGPAGEDAAADERTLQGSVTVHPAAAEAGHLTGGIQPTDRLTVGTQHP